MRRCGSLSFLVKNWQGNEAKDDCIINTYLIGIIYKIRLLNGVSKFFRQPLYSPVDIFQKTC